MIELFVLQPHKFRDNKETSAIIVRNYAVVKYGYWNSLLTSTLKHWNYRRQGRYIFNESEPDGEFPRLMIRHEHQELRGSATETEFVVIAVLIAPLSPVWEQFEI